MCADQTIIESCGTAWPQLRLPPNPVECGFRCGLVMVAPGTYMDCGPCPGVCGDTICQHGIGENHANCAADCPPGPCVSEGCIGRCGIVRDQCHRLINCGPCPSSCGDDICDPGEWITCQDDCGAHCQPEPACGLRCGIVDDGCGSGSAGSVEFSGGGWNVEAKATWFAQPDQECVSPATLATPALENAKYTVKVTGIAGSQIATGQAELLVQMPWGIGASIGGSDLAAIAGRYNT